MVLRCNGSKVTGYKRLRAPLLRQLIQTTSLDLIISERSRCARESVVPADTAKRERTAEEGKSPSCRAA